MEKEKTRDKKFGNLTTFFDGLDSSLIQFQSNKKNYEILVNYFIENFEEVGANVFGDLIGFLTEDNSKIHYGLLFKIMNEKLKQFKQDDELIRFAI